MAYSDERKVAGREIATLLELEIDTCGNTFSVNPCTATLAGPGLQCFNTFRTCQDVPNYNLQTKSIWFSSNRIKPIPGFNFIPSIQSDPSFSPAKLDRGRTLGRRAKITVTLRDHPHHDRGIDPYFDQRLYDPEEQGTFWGKFVARNPYYEGRLLNIYSGYVNDPFDINDFDKRTYVIDDIKGPSKNGTVQIIAKDVLKLADDKRAQAPMPTNSDLGTVIDDTSTEFTVTSDADFTPNLQYVRIEREIIEVTRVGTVLTIVNRSQFGSEQSDHDVGDNVQECLYYDNTNVVDVVENLLSDFTKTPAAFIPSAKWAIEKANNFSIATATTILSKPTGVTKLLSELAEQYQFWMVWDERLQEITLRSNTLLIDCDAPEQDYIFDSSNHIIKNSVVINRQPQKRVTQTWVYFLPRDYTDFSESGEKFKRINLGINQNAELPQAYGDTRLNIIYSRWFTFSNLPLVSSLIGRVNSRRSLSPIEVTWMLDAKDTDINVGDLCEVKALQTQNEFGEIFSPMLQVTSIKENIPGTRYTYTAEGDIGAGNSPRYGLIAPASVPDYPAATDNEKCKYVFICDEALPGFASDDSDCYLIQ